MKLLTKTSLIYILSTTLVFLIGGLVFYYNLRTIIDEEASEHIYLEKKLIGDYVKQHDTIPPTPDISGDFIQIKPVATPIKEFLRDTSIFSTDEDEILPYRTLTFPLQAKKQNYSATVSKALFESDDLVEAILYSFIVIIGVFLVAILLVNQIASKKLWRPFFNSVGLLHNYRIDKHMPLKFEETSTSEFKELNAALGKMTEKIASDYHNLKSFTENASHELQTPLSVIMASTELLLQDEKLDEKKLETIQRIHQTARKLSKLNQTLLLLAKIENRQFEEKENVDLGEVLLSKLELYSELIAHKEISLETSIAKNIHLQIHPALAEVMVSNLLSNAIRHNHNGGSIKIELNTQHLLCCNSGETKELDKEKLFGRFYKENTSTESTGLGLSLVKEVVESNGMEIHYNFDGTDHCFEITF